MDMLITKKEVEKFLIENGINKFKINKNLVVNVFQNVDLERCDGYFIRENLPVKFGKIYGRFDISDNELTTLKGCPEYVEGSFNCSRNSLKSLEHGPKFVGDSYNARCNQITSLMYLPRKLNGFVNLSYNKIEDIDFFDYEVGFYDIDLEGGILETDDKLLKNIGYIKNFVLVFNQKDIYNHWKIKQEREMFSKELAFAPTKKRINKI